MGSNFISGLFLENCMKLCLQEKKGASSKELLNIPISVSLLHEKEYENMLLCSKKRRSASEKRTMTTQKENKKDSILVDILLRSSVAKIM